MLSITIDGTENQGNNQLTQVFLKKWLLKWYVCLCMCVLSAAMDSHGTHIHLVCNSVISRRQHMVQNQRMDNYDSM